MTDPPEYVFKRFSLENPACSSSIQYELGTNSSEESLNEGLSLYEWEFDEEEIKIFPINIMSSADVFTFHVFTSSISEKTSQKITTVTSLLTLRFPSAEEYEEAIKNAKEEEKDEVSQVDGPVK